MADDLTLNAGSGGATLATDEVSSRHFPKGKTVFGADGTATDVTSTTGFPVRLSDGSGYLSALPVTDNGGSLTVDGTFWQATQPVSVAAVPSHDVTNAGTFAVQAAQSGTWNVTNVSGTVSLPTGAATAAKQPALGTAGTASADVLTVQGIASMTALKVDGSAVTQPVSGTVTANAGTGTMAVSAASLPLPSGAATSSAQTTGNAILSSIDGKVTACNTGAVTISAALPAGTNTIGKLAANSGVDIGDVDVTSVPADPFGANADAASATGSISAKLRFIAATGIPITGTVTVGSHAVTNAGTFAVQVDGTALTRLTDIETNTDSLAVVGNGAAATAQRVTLANDSTGVLGTVSTVTTLTGGGVAHDGVDSGNPHKIGAKATAALSGVTLVSAADRTDLYAGVDGVQITRPHCNLEDIVSGVVAITDGSSTSAIAAQGAGVKVYVTTVIVANSSATAVTVDIRDGAAGTVKATFPVPANTGGVVCNLPVPLPFSANTAVCADPSAAASTVTTTLIGFKSKV